MRDKKIEVDATLREIPAYTLGRFPSFAGSTAWTTSRQGS